MDGEPDHVHLLINYPPKLAISSLVNSLKGVSGRCDHRHRVVIGKDTRLSGYMLEPALTAGFTSMGMDVFLFGPLPTTYRKNKRPFHPSPTALDRS